MTTEYKLNYYKLLSTFKELTIEVEEFKNSLNFYEIREELTNLRGSPNVKDYLKMKCYYDDISEQVEEFKEELYYYHIREELQDLKLIINNNN